MKISLYKTFYLMTFCAAFASPAAAADWQQELNTLREDVKVLQRQVYRGIETNEKAASAANSDVQVKLTNWEETVRQVNGRLDELDHKVKSLDEKLDKINRDMEIRFKILEGRPVPSHLSAPAPMPVQTYDAPVAENGAKSAVGDQIRGDDLAPIDGPSPQTFNTEPPAPASIPTIKTTTAEDTYAMAMQAYNNGLYDEAELAFEDILKQHPQHNLAGNAQYWLGEVYVKQNNLNKAKIAFKNGYQNYHNGNKAADSLYRLGITLENLKETKNACIVFSSFNAEFPQANADLKNKAAAEAKKLGCK